MKLYEIAKLIRTKNAGPFMLTIDVLFETKEAYEKVLHSGKLTRETVAELYDIEDQVVPKRIDYHQGKHYIVSAEEMMLKLECAVKARSSDDFLVIARTDAGRNEGESFSHAIERAKLYSKSGADILKVFARTEEEMINAPKQVDFPLWYVASEGLGRPIPTPAEAKALGYKGISYPQTALQAAYRAVKQVYENIYNTGSSGVSKAEAKALADEIMGIIPIDELAHLDPQNLKLVND